jgi:3-oxoacyl-[acyl-carrier-protein] synthase I
MNNRVYVIGMGTLSAIGDDVASSLASLTQLRTGIGAIHRLATQYAPTLPAAEVAHSNETLAAKCNLSAHLTRTALLSMWAASEAVASTGIDLHPFRSGFISSNTVGGMDKTEDFFKEYLLDATQGHLRDAAHHDSGAATEIVAGALGITDVVSTISTACSSSANTIMYGARMIRAGMLDIAIAGGTDALSRFTLNGFKSLMILDDALCQPMDENRRGLNLGEGAGYIVLASEQIVELNGLNPIAILSGYANANDAYHQTASSAEGKGNYLAMQGALTLARLAPSDIDYINLHGTGTGNNDLSEGTAVMRLFGDRVPHTSSTKAYTGHTLAASGGIEAVYSLLAIREQMIFPNLRYETRMKELNFDPITTLMRDTPVRHVMSNSFGFGGNCSSLIFSKV